MTPTHDLARRRFLKTFALTTVYAGACGSLGKLFIAEVQAQSAQTTGIFPVDITATGFTALQNVNGSVIVRVPGTSTTFPSIIITRTSTTQFFAVTSQCTHAGCTVGIFNGVSLNCPCHGSRFSPQGAVVLGPAAAPLQGYATTFDGIRTLRIAIPNLAYSVTTALVPVTAGKRIRLVFRTVSGSRYGARFRQTLGSSESVLSFATSQTGLANVTQVFGTGGNMTIYVDPPVTTGFYSIVTFL